MNISKFSESFFFPLTKECPRGVVGNVLDWGIVDREFELQSRYYIHFRTNTQFISLAMG